MKTCINCGQVVIETDTGFYCPDCGLVKETIRIEPKEEDGNKD